MKLARVSLSGFRGYSAPVTIEFAPDFTILDGRNGVGKSTVFDAVEYALTGSLSKYGQMKSSGESVADYLWWSGNRIAGQERYVEVVFRDADGEIVVRREAGAGHAPVGLQVLESRICDPTSSPIAPLAQLCASALIRDEFIATLSLDMKDTERYSMLRRAIGDSAAEAWTAKAEKVYASSKIGAQIAVKEVDLANSQLTLAARRLDDLRASLSSDVSREDAVRRLRQLTGSNAAVDELLNPARDRLAVLQQRITTLNRLAVALAEEERLRATARELHLALLTEEDASTRLRATLAARASAAPRPLSSALALQATQLMSLVDVGRSVDLQEGCCPLCASSISAEAFARSLAATEAKARALDESAAQAVAEERADASLEAELSSSTQRATQLRERLVVIEHDLHSLKELQTAAGYHVAVDMPTVALELESVQRTIEQGESDVRVLDSLRRDTELQTASRAFADATAKVASVQERLSTARRVEFSAKELFDACRRSASETVDGRLERILPLMVELYQRMRPHPVWNDIQYSIRGDVRRFLQLQVGESLNPQFMFSSGQRRSTGLAYLLSIHMSLAWSRFKCVLLDDPVQHVDDFRAVHLAELAAQLVQSDYQVVCAVEDAALAEMYCRRLPVRGVERAKHYSLGIGPQGTPGVTAERWLLPLPSRVTAESQERATA